MAIHEHFTTADGADAARLRSGPDGAAGEDVFSELESRGFDAAGTRSSDQVAERHGSVSNDVGPDTNALDVARRRPADTASESARRDRREPAVELPAVRTPGLAAWTRRYLTALVVTDAAVGLLAVLLALPMLNYPFSPARTTILILGAGVAWPLAVAISHGYERSNIGVGDDEMRAVMRAVVFAIAVGSVPAAVTENLGVVATSVIAVPLAGLGSLISRFVTRKNLHRQQRAGRNVRRVIVVGSAYAAADLASVLARESHAGMNVIGVCVPRTDVVRARDAGLAVVGDLDQVPELIHSYGADAVAVTGSDVTRHNYLRELSWALEGAGVELLVHPGLVEVAGPRMHIRPYVGLPLLHIEQPHFTGWRRFVKRAADLVLTGTGLIVISPVLAALALAVKLNDGGPVIFRQTRVGLDGSTFTMLKFRSMHVDAEAKLAELRAQNPNMGHMFKMEDDPRITRVGKFLRKFSLDELPQLFNVLTGSMSLVGPRPPLQSEVDGYEDHARRRLLVTPGLTGLWQVSGRSLLSWEETVRLDLRYVENWTLTLDLLILWKTVFAVVARRGAY
ncbi:MAG: Exopolysaccharide biosynthesis polyprenyl glycosylphosphotransferase [uncultured Friedmanniella sp.]|uniref:Exopolysaccharide biosynthesis polyprenyl glycosylphosphotransferase n=1 Tax=uncultured Friedmanniella sp. TaxID=335381 RepID=A0A6J4KMT7_9ACTN|nr:sugar transferase [uncultured Friedmanniella sp.]CAA9310304.1 MAG: Exopolysaccharide biosynthesis polyprenyl glycosylphosphotransferase [uncultured Friedmanniella sp.]